MCCVGKIYFKLMGKVIVCMIFQWVDVWGVGLPRGKVLSYLLR